VPAFSFVAVRSRNMNATGAMLAVSRESTDTRNASMKSPLFAAVLAFASAGTLPFHAASAAEPAQADVALKHAVECYVGAYRLPDASIDIGPSDGGLRWRHVDGRSGKLVMDGDGGWKSLEGWTDRADGHRIALSGCGRDAKLHFDGVVAPRIAFEVRETAFAGDGGTRLEGRLVMPEGDAQVPLVVLVHGAEHDSARTWDFMQRQLPAEGVAAFVYDKRGTGDSEGSYTQDYGVLANDAVAAMQEAKRMAGARANRFGFRGGSQGGWVAPLAATRTRVDFVIVGYGLAVNALQEDREATILQMQLKGYPPDIIDSALEITDAAAVVVSSDGERGIPEFDAVRMKYRDRPWYKDVYGNFTHVILPYMGDDLRRMAQQYKWGTPWHYDPMPVLRELRTPQLWELGDADIDAPMGETFHRLRSLAREGAPITIAVFPGGEHGMTTFEKAADGTRTSLRYAEGYTRMTVDFARGKLGTAYGKARIYRAGD
jgi:alpha/beta superfamily hydrolase